MLKLEHRYMTPAEKTPIGPAPLHHALFYLHVTLVRLVANELRYQREQAAQSRRAW